MEHFIKIIQNVKSQHMEKTNVGIHVRFAECSYWDCARTQTSITDESRTACQRAWVLKVMDQRSQPGKKSFNKKREISLCKSTHH